MAFWLHEHYEECLQHERKKEPNLHKIDWRRLTQTKSVQEPSVEAADILADRFCWISLL